MAQIKGFYNEKGNVSAKVRNSIKDQAIARVVYALQNDERLAGYVKNADGGISVPVFTNERGETVYALISITISTKDPAVKTEHKKTAKKTAESTYFFVLVLF